MLGESGMDLLTLMPKAHFCIASLCTVVLEVRGGGSGCDSGRGVAGTVASGKWLLSI